MPEKDYRRYLAVAGELLKRRAMDCKAKAAGKNPLREGILLGWVEALDVLRDCLEAFDLSPLDLAWEDFVPERDLLGIASSPEVRRDSGSGE